MRKCPTVKKSPSGDLFQEGWVEEKCCEAVWAWLFYTFFLPRRILGTSTSATSSAPAVEQIDLELPDPAVISGRSTSRLIHRVTDETPGTGIGGGPLLLIINTKEWLTSSSAQRSTSATTWRLGGGESTAWRSAVKPVAFGSEGDASNIYFFWVKIFKQLSSQRQQPRLVLLNAVVLLFCASWVLWKI